MMSTRRQFLKQGAALALIPLVPAVSITTHAAAKVPLDDPAAKALRYVEDATEANRADKMGVAAADQVCQNSRYYVTTDASAAWSPCQQIQNRDFHCGNPTEIKISGNYWKRNFIQTLCQFC
jgi:hypothetical protein